MYSKPHAGRRLFCSCRRGWTLADWPEGLADVFTPAEKVLSLNLSAQQPLAAQSASRVMEEIASRGYFLQLPPDPR